MSSFGLALVMSPIDRCKFLLCSFTLMAWARVHFAERWIHPRFEGTTAVNHDVLAIRRGNLLVWAHRKRMLHGAGSEGSAAGDAAARRRRQSAAADAAGTARVSRHLPRRERRSRTGGTQRRSRTQRRWKGDPFQDCGNLRFWKH